MKHKDVVGEFVYLSRDPRQADDADSDNWYPMNWAGPGLYGEFPHDECSAWYRLDQLKSIWENQATEAADWLQRIKGVE